MSRRYRYLTLLAGLLALAAFVVLRVALPPPFTALREAAFDLLQLQAPRQERPVPVTVVDIDDTSLERVGQWPWPRDTLARLIAQLDGMGAAAIVLDILLSEPDRASPARLVADWQRRGLLDLSLAPDAMPDFDRDLAATMAAARVVTGFGLTPRPSSRAPAIKAGFAVIGPDPIGGLFAFPGAVTNLPVLEAAATGNGSFSLVGGDGGIVRRIPLLSAFRGELVPSLALEALRVAQRQETIAVRTAPPASAPFVDGPGMLLRVGGIEIPVNSAGEYWLHFRPAGSGRMLPAWQVLDGQVLDGQADIAARVRGHIVLIGTSAVGLSDLRTTPVNPFEPGVNLHAQALEQILTGAHLVRPPWAPAGELALGLAGAAIVLLCAAWLRPAVALGLFLALAAALGLGAFGLFTGARLLLDPVTPALAMATAFAAASLTRTALVEGDRRRLRHAFAHYLAPEMVRAIADRPDRLRLGGESRSMTFLFTDLEGFTRYTEQADPAELVEVMNAYLSEVCGIVMRHGGTIDKIVGDAVHAMFNAPLDQPDHADRAVACAIEIGAATDRFAAAQADRGRSIGITRIGVNTGPAVVGNFGGAGRFDYTAHGDAINTAARLEAANKPLGTRICIAGATAKACRRFAFRPIATLLVKGRSTGIETVAPVAAETEAVRAYRQAFETLAAGGPDAGAAMLAHAAAHPDDPLARLHAARIAAGETGTVVNLS
ncbi:CHASE2 domain-containing protein [Marinibaculum pumilum]|uniref:CHASE2 domain-containing protein n=1 Tax=Marinibaculum pumilum TaxID=1766165 RepID=A0ABV7L5F0_9PROT